MSSSSTADGERLATRDLNNMPSTVGGAGFHADGKLPRYREVDFRLASELGPVEGADVADWPLDYDELEPFYAEAERSIGVAGDHTGNPFAAWRSGPYPMPPGADMYLTTLTAPAAETLGYQEHTTRLRRAAIEHLRQDGYTEPLDGDAWRRYPPPATTIWRPRLNPWILRGRINKAGRG